MDLDSNGIYWIDCVYASNNGDANVFYMQISPDTTDVFRQMMQIANPYHGRVAL